MSDSMQEYDDPLGRRYASRRMRELWSPQRKFSTWRRLWVALAEAEAELGLPISPEQIAELKAHVDDIDFAAADRYERRFRHDVMAHVHAYGDVCPTARPIIHLGATSCYVTDNTDLLLLREGLTIVRDRVVAVIDRLGRFAERYRELACLAFTHFQPAQPTTVGKRACLWAYDLVLDLEEIEHRIRSLRALGSKGTTGTEASFLELLGGDHEKVRQLEELVCRKIGLDRAFVVTGQTYPRKVRLADPRRALRSGTECSQDGDGFEALAAPQRGRGAIRGGANRIVGHGLQAEPHAERTICSLARFVMGLESNPAMTAATQWLERTLTIQRQPPPRAPPRRSSPRMRCSLFTRMSPTAWWSIPKSLPGQSGGRVALHGHGEYPHGRSSGRRGPAGIHERIRQHSRAAALVVKQEGGRNDLMDRLAGDPAFSKVDLGANA